MLNSGFKDSLDVANQALIHLGLPLILAVDEDSNRNTVMSGLYTKARQYELRRNVWRFSKRAARLRAIDLTTRLLDPSDWETGVTYLPGAIVKHTNGDLWVSFMPENIGNEPGVTDVWEPYTGPMSISLYDSTITYSAGELVYKATSLAGSFVVYVSRINGNTSAPDTVTAYDATVTYGINDVVSYSGYQWRSVIPYNLANTPAVAPSDWDKSTNYDTDDTATAGDGYIYKALSDSNLGNDPVLDDGTLWSKQGPYAWNRIPVLQSSSKDWLPLFANATTLGLEHLNLMAEDGRNVFLLPSGYLRQVRRQPKVIQAASDFEVYGDYILSHDATILLSFSADHTKVSKMDPMFCEMLALRMAEQACETLNQDETKLAAVMAKYKRAATEAREVNAIENGYEEPDEDDFVTVRL